METEQERLAMVPPVDSVLRTETANSILRSTGAKHLTVLARAVTDSVRRDLRDGAFSGASRESLLEESERRLETFWRKELGTGSKRVINASGVVIHTNLGRAPLSEAARQAISNASGYCNLEYSLETGRRGKRGARAECLLAELTGAESALIVNNCAAAAFLVLRVLACGGEVVISRGELVEIGGDFRVPDVLTESGAVLREVGTTNRTKLADYERAINDGTRLILKVHPSNYRIVGFTAAPELSELAELAHRNGLVLFEDAGSGALFDLGEFGLRDEPVIPVSIAAGADVVTFSGDKLLGGVQSGLIVGRSDVIERIRKHPLYRALRVDKLAYAALEATLEAYRREPLDEIPVLRMLSAKKGDLEVRAADFAARLNASTIMKATVIPGHSVIGGGSAPAVQPETALITLEHSRLSAARFEERLRLSDPPVITRIVDGNVAIDLRTVGHGEVAELIDCLMLVA
ncbi:MAG: L-seryl-tRNA(Sec) selenium transferase [Acidobacteria bacterium]|nr:L-seryl-tRNA(Sec) selenium transferase [Acidobacteriota bacterium]MBK8148699.1 L-seryl-tRNA(Sec) selenium transferase [Acidobacteriota bacterium]